MLSRITSKLKNVELKIIPALIAFGLCFSMAPAHAGTRPEPVAKSFQTSDGAVLCGDVYAGKGVKAPPTVIMLHMLGRDRRAFAPLVTPVLDAGFNIVNMDLRGHGQSATKKNGAAYSFKSFAERDWAFLPSDAQTIIEDVAKIPGLNSGSVAVVGSSIGANAAAMAGSNPNVKALVLLSPGADYHGLKPEQSLKSLNKPVLIFVGSLDRQSNEGVQKWAKECPRLKVETLMTLAHGNDLLTDPNVVKKIVTFLQTEVK